VVSTSPIVSTAQSWCSEPMAKRNPGLADGQLGVPLPPSPVRFVARAKATTKAITNVGKRGRRARLPGGICGLSAIESGLGSTSAGSATPA